MEPALHHPRSVVSQCPPFIPLAVPAATLTLRSGRGLPLQRPACGHSRTQSHLTDHITTATRTVLLYSCSRHPGTLDWTSLRKYRISRYRRNLQNRNSAAAGIAIRFGPNILLKCPVRQTVPEYPTITLDFAYKSSFSLNRTSILTTGALPRRRIQIFVLTQSLRSIITTGAPL